jgi:3-isopropylmalate dehydratase small subunit
MIIPKEYLKTIKRTGLGFAAFAELRYTNPVEVAQHGEEVADDIPDFVLNRPEYTADPAVANRTNSDGTYGAKILIAGDNFGCGSSREHAPWSINGTLRTCNQRCAALHPPALHCTAIASTNPYSIPHQTRIRPTSG